MVMTPGIDPRIDTARHRADQALLRATRAAEIAERHEQQSRQGPEMLAEFHQRMARTQRRSETAHRVAARIHSSYARQLHLWADAASGIVAPPSFIEAVADEAGTGSVAVVLFGTDQVEAMVATSDAVSRTAQDVEFTLGEGPSRDAARRQCRVTATGGELVARWPRYGPAVAGLGVREVVAVPLGRDAGVGALTVLSGPLGGSATTPVISWPVVETVADVVTGAMLAEVGRTGPEDPPGTLLLDGADDRQVVHVAAGVVAEQLGCDFTEAVALIRARAFADGVASTVVAEQVVAGELHLSAT
jgi:hypothetical protein